MKIPRIALLSIPAIVFLLLLAVLVAQSPKRQAATTEIPQTSTTITVATVTPKTKTELEILIEDIANYSPQDPNFALPNIDRQISLPE